MTERRRNLAERIADPLTPEILRQRQGEGETLREIAESWVVPYGRLLSWVAQQGDLSDELRRAREVHAHELVAEAVEIADTPQVGVRTKTTEDGTETVEEDMLGHRKLQVDTRLKAARAFLPKVYGENVKHEISGVVTLDAVLAVMDAQLLADRADMAQRQQPALEHEAAPVKQLAEL